MAGDRRAARGAVRDGNRRPAAAALGALVLMLSAACGGGADDTAEVALSVAFEPAPPRVGPTTFALTLTGADGAPVEGAAVEVEGNMSHAGMVPVFGAAREVAPGSYEVELELTMGGDWFLLVEADLVDGRTLLRRHDVPGVRSQGNP